MKPLTLSLTTSLLLLTSSFAQETPKNEAKEASKRSLYAVKYGSAKDIAAALGKHFQKDADFQVVENTLLISASAGVLPEVTKVLETLDKAPQQIHLEILILDVPLKKDDKPLDEADFTGPARDVMTKLNDYQGKGRVVGIRSLQLAVLERIPANVRVTENKAIATSVVSNRGIAQCSIEYRDVGAAAKVTASVGPENKVLVDLDVSESRIVFPEEGAAIGKDEKGTAIYAPEFTTAKLETKLSIPTGHIVAAQGAKTSTKTTGTQTLILVSARVSEAKK